MTNFKDNSRNFGPYFKDHFMIFRDVPPIYGPHLLGFQGSFSKFKDISRIFQNSN